MNKIRMEIKISNAKDEHVLKFDEQELQIMIAALYDWYSADGEEEYLSDEMSGALNYFYGCLKPDDDYVTLYDEVTGMSKPYFLLIDQKRNVVQIPYDYEDLRDWLAYAANDSARRITACETNKQLIDLIRAYLKMSREEMIKEEN